MYKISKTEFDKMPDELKALYVKLPNPSSEEVRECFPEGGGGKFSKSGNRIGGNCEYSVGINGRKDAPDNYGDSGNASRFFKSIIYQAKASKSERNKGLDLHKLISIMGLDLSSNNPLGSTEQPDQNQLHLLDIDLSPQKEGSECEIKIKKGKDLSMSLYEKLLTDQYLNDYKSTIKTTTNGTTTLTTLNWLRHCITKEYIADVNGEIEFGESLVEIVEGGKKSTTTIKGKLGYLLGVKNVVAEMQLIIKEKENKNHHSTVKPIALMEYLIKMVTPKCGVVLDPFMGSGTTGCASKKNGYNYIGFELDKGYREIANKRIQSIQSQLF